MPALTLKFVLILLSSVKLRVARGQALFIDLEHGPKAVAER